MSLRAAFEAADSGFERCPQAGECEYAQDGEHVPGNEQAQGEGLAEGEGQQNGRIQGRFIAALEVFAAAHELSRRETEVFKYLAMGRGADYIAEQLTISWNTVRTHTQNVYQKVGVHSRNELMDLVDTLKKG
jgi:DNA-binding NarL/FixJ family response regulator